MWRGITPAICAPAAAAYRMDVRVDHVYAALTIAPGSSKEYSKPEFGRDLYLSSRAGKA